MADYKIPIDLKGLLIKEETTFSTDPTPASGVDDVRALNIKFTPQQNIHFAGYQKSGPNMGPDTGIKGAKGGTVTFDIPLRGSASVAVSPFMKLAKQLGSYFNYNQATTVDGAGASASQFDVNSATDLHVGDAVMLQLGGSGTPEIRFISAIATKTITVEPAFSATPSGSETLHDIATLTSESLCGEPTKYFTIWAYSGQDNTDGYCYKFNGCCGSWKIKTITVDTIPYVEFTFNVNTWTYDNATSLAQAADGFGTPLPMLGSPMRVDDTQWATESFEFDPGIEIVPYVDTNGTNGRQGWICVKDEPTVKIKPYYNDDWITKWEGPTTFQLHIENVKDTDEGWAWYAPKVQVISVAEGDIQGIASAEMELKLIDSGNVNIPKWAIAVTSL